jgi:predicted lipoprotein
LDRKQTILSLWRLCQYYPDKQSPCGDNVTRYLHSDEQVNCAYVGDRSLKFDLLSAAKHAGMYKSQATGYRPHYILYSNP